MPAEEQIPQWEVLELIIRISNGYSHLDHRLLHGKKLEELLEMRLTSLEADSHASTEASGFGPSESLEFVENSICSTISDGIHRAPLDLHKILAEKKHNPISMYSNAYGDWYGVIATLDTGSDENWVSQEVVDRLKLDVSKGLVCEWKTFNGHSFESDSSVKVTWCSRGRGTSRVNVFRVVPNGPFDVLFGRTFILSEQANMFAADEGHSLVLGNFPTKLSKCERKKDEEERKKVEKDVKKASKNHGQVKPRIPKESKSQKKSSRSQKTSTSH
ncbi:hypothetical protein N431DRAFT_449044 [Stipitochalara longipes BDJ]|nr:hypothetical protein N431DRAFT_449044 [Stipitochalara longipes BDJ]